MTDQELIARVRDTNNPICDTDRVAAADLIEALVKVLEWWKEDSAKAWDKCEERRLAQEAAEAEVARLTAEIAEAVAKATRVKPLVWHEGEYGDHRKGEVFSAINPVSFAPIAAHKKHDGWWLNVDCTTYPTLEAAKAAAQADYEARILAAIGWTENE